MNSRLTGPAIAILATILYHLAFTGLGIGMPTVAWITPLVAWAGFAGGLRAGVAAGVWAGLYSLYLTGDALRATVVALSLVVTGAIIGYRTRQWRAAIEALEASVKAEKKARLAAEYNQSARNFVDQLDGNIELLDETIGRVSDLLKDWSNLHNDARRDRLRMIRHDLVQLLTATQGWLQLAWIKELIVKEDSESPKPGFEKTEAE
jgi:hypothetical protein